MKRIIAICLASAALAACQTGEMGPTAPPPPSRAYPPPPSASRLRESDFAWSRGAGYGGILGWMGYGGGAANYTCGDVVLLPETPWTEARMQRLYGSMMQAVLPVDQVRARSPSDATDEAESNTSAKYARHAQCNAADKFSFAGLPDGAWYLITVATPRTGGPKIALMKRVVTYGGVFRVVLR